MSEAQAVAAVVRKVLTRAEKIEKAESQIKALAAQVAELRAEETKEQALQSIGAGAKVTFKAGRADTLRTVGGVVLAAYDADGKRKVKVLAGEGAEAELFEVAVSALLTAELPVVEPAQTEATEPLADLS